MNNANVLKLIRFTTAAIFLAAVFLVSFLVRNVSAEDTEEICREYEGMEFVRKGEEFCVKYKDKVIFSPEEGVRTQDFLLCDIDSDGNSELLILCLKEGRFGKHRPFWIKENDSEVSQHIFIYEIEKGRISAKWMSSDIGFYVSKWDYFGNVLSLSDENNEESYWQWRTWGLDKTDDIVTLMFVGDNIIHRPIYEYAAEQDMNFDFAYNGISKYIRKMNAAVFVSETPLVDKSEAYGDFPSFGTPCEISRSMRRAGFDVAACATNHILDRGAYGLDCTLESYAKEGITTVGIDDKYTIRKIKGLNIAFLDYTSIINTTDKAWENIGRVNFLGDEEKVRKTIREAKRDSDFVIMIVHWGTEYSRDVDEQQEKWANVFLEEGVDVCIGSHPHVTQKSEVLYGKNHEMPIFYSLGNFYSAQNKEGTDRGKAVYLAIGKEYGKAVLKVYKEYDVGTIKKAGKYCASISVGK